MLSYRNYYWCWQYNADDLVLLANKPVQAESQLLNLEQATEGIDVNVNSNKTNSMCFR